MPKLGSHMSIAGGYYKAVEAAAVAGCDCVQLFTKNSNQWAAKPITPQDAEAFAGALHQHRVSDPISHASYLINLASPNPDLREKSCGALATELHRAGQAEKLFSLAAISKLNWLSSVLRPRISKPICSNQQPLILHVMVKCQLPGQIARLWGSAPP